ncbi:hypothetical protein VPH35_139116 [Triticum aestivum]
MIATFILTRCYIPVFSVDFFATTMFDFAGAEVNFCYFHSRRRCSTVVMDFFFWEPRLPPESENGVAASFEAGVELVHGGGGVGSAGAQSSGGGFFRVWHAAARGGRCGEDKEKRSSIKRLIRRASDGWGSTGRTVRPVRRRLALPYHL